MPAHLERLLEDAVAFDLSLRLSGGDFEVVCCL